MSLKHLLSQNKLIKHKTSAKEISNLLRLVRRDLKDAHLKELSADRRFTTAYNGVLQLATIVLYCKGYKTKGAGAHFTVFQAMKGIMGPEFYQLADYFDSCRVKRNIADYDYAGIASESEVKELVKEAESFLQEILIWLEKNYPELLQHYK
jgi:uncharacterized protein (UPF0332 family)